MPRTILKLLILMAIGALAAFWWLTIPQRGEVKDLAALTGDITNGQDVFWAAGCASCHAAPGAEDDARLTLVGGMAFASPFGTFFAPNISQDPTHGIGAWTLAELSDAMRHGTSPNGAHYYPAFPFTSYARAKVQDIADLYAFLKTLPASDIASKPHDVGFPFNIRRGLGLWKQIYPSPNPVIPVVGDTVKRGQYLVEALGHCGECHTPRNALGALDYGRWLYGAPSPDGKGKVPALTPDRLTWSSQDIVAYLSTGFTPEYDSAGGHMADVVLNLAHLSKTDLQAITAYLKALPTR